VCPSPTQFTSVTTEKTESEVRDGFQRRQDRDFAGLAAEQDKCQEMLATLVRIPELGDRTFIELEMIAAEADVAAALGAVCQVLDALGGFLRLPGVFPYGDMRQAAVEMDAVDVLPGAAEDQIARRQAVASPSTEQPLR
jgi:hypothetical protein